MLGVGNMEYVAIVTASFIFLLLGLAKLMGVE